MPQISSEDKASCYLTLKQVVCMVTTALYGVKSDHHILHKAHVRLCVCGCACACVGACLCVLCVWCACVCVVCVVCVCVCVCVEETSCECLLESTPSRRDNTPPLFEEEAPFQNT
jgi:hypothetical protein